ncbi:hypothetical protein LRD18_11980 [Halorhodospira halochloris]|uniref:hypothetical protein n=1 Tax=Halorhodospira halochloris TaxID=1052 RepID=UPI001EE79F06|nr:hypothetical protein [Halorhodospira halochloris]MCG5531562.1 hypothetical protein [Halorhodospira halochloris]
MNKTSPHEHRIPINRKESFYTGTIFPMLAAEGGFEALRRIITEVYPASLDIPLLKKPWRQGWDMQFFTEYSLKESIVPDMPNKMFENIELSGSKETPDIVLYFYPNDTQASPLRGTLVGIEAKMFTQPSLPDLEGQISAQRQILQQMSEKLDNCDLYQLVLIPEETIKKYDEQKLSDSVQKGRFQGWLTWNSVLDAWQKANVDYASPAGLFAKDLEFALENFDSLVSEVSRSGQNCDAKLTGKAIYNGFKEGSTDFTYKIMGCSGGLNGNRLNNHIEKSEWQYQEYEVSNQHEPFNHNWFSIDDFVKKIDNRCPKSDDH